ncbi:MAG: hypothetical protein MSH65_03675 [Spirochaetia bacterium]|nr:hypothetical protein [Spirochaetia bacterium]MDY3721464.1 hypothetical protein [Treponema sp.]
MKNRFIVVYTVFAAAVFIFSLSFFGFNLYREYSANVEKSEDKYKTLVSDIRNLSFNQAQNNSLYSKGIKDAVGDTGAYAFIQVRRYGETVVYYPSGKLKEETVSKLTKSFTKEIIVNTEPILIDCNIYLIRPDSIFYYARVSFLMILIITIITIIMIIYLNLSEQTSGVISLTEEAIKENDDDENLELNAEEDKVSEDTNETEEDSITSENNSENEIIVEDTGDFENLNNKTEECEENEHKLAEVTPEEVKAILSEPLTDQEAQKEETVTEPAKLPVDEVAPAETDIPPSGLFDPETGIGWESYLLTRLNNEIDRATASEIDLSLFVVKLPEVDMKSEIFKNVCNYLAIQFQFKDLLFEHKNDSIIAIKISMNVNEALNLADKLYSDICNILNNRNCRIGISSRSIRMVTGERLILEAEQSIEHTDANSPVIAFRVDSEKYRQLMEQN